MYIYAYILFHSLFCYERLSLIITEMQIKATMRYHLTRARMAIITNSTKINAGECVEKMYTIGRNINWYSHYGEQYGGTLKN